MKFDTFKKKLILILSNVHTYDGTDKTDEELT